MTVREFNGTTDTIRHAIGGFASCAFGTGAAILRPADNTGGHTTTALHNGSGSVRNDFVHRSNANPSMFSNATGFVSGGGSPMTNAPEWYMVVGRKATGTATPRFSVYRYSTDTWAHGDAGGTLADWGTPGASGTIRTDMEATEFLNGRLAVRAAWSNNLPWAASAGGDAALEAAGLHLALQAWVDAAPTGLWVFDQASTATPCDDLTGNGADQVALTGTTVVADAPPGFDYTLGGGSPGSVWGGAAWVAEGTLQPVWDGAAWATPTAEQVWDGAAWV